MKDVAGGEGVPFPPSAKSVYPGEIVFSGVKIRAYSTSLSSEELKDFYEEQLQTEAYVDSGRSVQHGSYTNYAFYLAPEGSPEGKGFFIKIYDKFEEKGGAQLQIEVHVEKPSEERLKDGWV